MWTIIFNIYLLAEIEVKKELVSPFKYILSETSTDTITWFNDMNFDSVIIDYP